MTAVYVVLACLISFLLFFLLQGKVDTNGLKLAAVLTAALIAVLALAILRVWKARTSNPSTVTETQFPNPERARKFMVIIGVVALMFGALDVLDLFDQTSPRPATALTATLRALMGPLGPAVFDIGVGAIVLLWAWKRSARK